MKNWHVKEHVSRAEYFSYLMTEYSPDSSHRRGAERSDDC